MANKAKSKLDISKIHLVGMFVDSEKIESAPNFVRTAGQVNYNIGSSLSISASPESNIIKAVMSIDIQTLQNGKVVPNNTYSIDIAYWFQVDDLSDVSSFTGEGDSKVFTFHEEMGVFINSIGFSSARGLILSRLANTSMNDFLLPIIDPRNYNIVNVNS